MFGRSYRGGAGAIFAVCSTILLAAAAVRNSYHLAPTTIEVDRPATFAVNATECPAEKKHAVLRVAIQFIDFEPGAAVIVSDELTGHIIGTIAAYGTATGQEPVRYTLVLPKDVVVCVDNSPKPLSVKLTLEQPEGTDSPA